MLALRITSRTVLPRGGAVDARWRIRRLPLAVQHTGSPAHTGRELWRHSGDEGTDGRGRVTEHRTCIDHAAKGALECLGRGGV
eukprot:scaffold13863_cov35-Tisochrysis_lutea.AAC.7